MQPSVALGASLIVTLACGAAHGQAASPVVEWDEAAGCARPADLLDRVAQTIGLARAALSGKLISLRVTTTATDSGGWRAQLYLETAAGAGERSFEAESCDSLIKATVLVVGLALDADAATRVATKPVAVRRASPPVTGRGASPHPVTRPQPRSTLGGQVRALAGVDLGLLPGPSASFALAGGLRWRAFRLELEVAHDLPQTTTLTGGRAGAELSMPLRGAVRGCTALWRPWRVELGACLGPELGWLRGTGLGIRNPRQGDALWLGILVGGTANVRLWRWLWLRLEALVGVSALRPTFRIDDLGEVHRPSLVVGRLGGGLEVWFR